MQPTDVYPLLGTAWRAAGQFFGSAYEQKIAEVGLDPESPDWPLLAVSLDFEPETTSAKRLAARTPYSNPQRYISGLASLAKRGLMESVGPDEYRITAKGHAVTYAVNGELRDQLAALAQREAAPVAEVSRVVEILGKLVDACLNAPEPADKSSLAYNRHSDQGPGAPVLLRMAQYVADMGAFRDDSHLAAWRPYRVSGPAWEALTLVWRGDASTAGELVEKLPYRHLSDQDYTAALDTLIQKGWVTAENGTYHLTAEGTRIREEAEAATDRYFYAPWSALSETELDELASLLTRVHDELTAMHEKEAAA